MQVDHHTNSSTPTTQGPNPQPKPSRFHISDKAIENACLVLLRVIRDDDNDDEIRYPLHLVWSIVHDALQEDLELIGRLADSNEFEANVQREGVEEFISLLRQMKSEGSFQGLLENEVFLKPIPNPEHNFSAVSVNATIRAWSSPFRGNAANVLLATISSYLSTNRDRCPEQTTILNSSGTGKSRMVDELAKKIITVPMCLRDEASPGFPPSDIALRGWFISLRRSASTGLDEKIYCFLRSLLNVTFHKLQEIESDLHDIPTLPMLYDRHQQNMHADSVLIKRRQEMLALAFRDRMTRGQELQRSNAYRRSFYLEVIRLATEFAFAFNNVQDPGKENDSLHNSQLETIVEEGERLCQYLDPHGVLNSISPRRPLFILAFDDPDILMDEPKHQALSFWAHMCHTLGSIERLPIFSLFLESGSDPSNRTPVYNYDRSSLDPIPEISFDDLAFPANENTVTLDQVVQSDWISHLGRPLFGSVYDELAKDGNESEILLFAKQKLLDGKPALVNGDRAESLACLSVRFSLEFYEDPVSRAVACSQVGHHLRLCLAATAATAPVKELVTFAGSEPLLAEAAFELLGESRVHPVLHLANHPDLSCIDRGRRGELVAALIVMQARDACAFASKRRWVSVSDFMEALFPSSAFEKLQECRPIYWREREDIPFGKTFRDYRMWFNHVIRVEDEDSKMLSADNLWKFITRGAMVVCSNNQCGVDIVLPACVTHEKLSRDNVTAILIRVKNEDCYKRSINKPLFDAMDPFRVGLFSDESEQRPRPVIRLVFALASDEAGVLLPTPTPRSRKRRQTDPFTAFDIWCAGLSQDTFKLVDEDLKPHYRALLDRSLLPHDIFNLPENRGRATRFVGGF